MLRARLLAAGLVVWLLPGRWVAVLLSWVCMCVCVGGGAYGLGLCKACWGLLRLLVVWFPVRGRGSLAASFRGWWSCSVGCVGSFSDGSLLSCRWLVQALACPVGLVGRCVVGSFGFVVGSGCWLSTILQIPVLARFFMHHAPKGGLWVYCCGGGWHRLGLRGDGEPLACRSSHRGGGTPVQCGVVPTRAGGEAPCEAHPGVTGAGRHRPDRRPAESKVEGWHRSDPCWVGWKVRGWHRLGSP